MSSPKLQSEGTAVLRNNNLYEATVYSGKKLLFRFRDSLNLLPGKLSSLAANLCPELGEKGCIEHKDVSLSNLLSLKDRLLSRTSFCLVV